MVSFILNHRDDLFLVFAMSMVLVPLILGLAMGHVPKEFVLRIGLPFVLLTVSMALGLFFLKRVLKPLPMLAVSIVFGLTWAGVGLQGISRRNQDWLGTGEPMPPAIRGLSWLFCLFGALWVLIAIGNYYGWV